MTVCILRAREPAYAAQFQIIGLRDEVQEVAAYCKDNFGSPGLQQWQVNDLMPVFYIVTFFDANAALAFTLRFGDYIEETEVVVDV